MAVLIDVDVDEATPKLYGVSAMPTLVITDAEGTELSKVVGAPFSTPEGAIKWFDEIGGKITAFQELFAKWNESKHTDTASGEKYAEAAAELGKMDEAVSTYKTLIASAGEDKVRAAALNLKVAKLFVAQYDAETAAEYADQADKLTPAEGDARIDVDVVRAKILLFSEKPEDARKLAQKHFDTLVKAADARALDLAEVLMGTEDQGDEPALYKKGRELYQSLAKAFAKHERIWELKVYAAWYGLNTDAREACMAELKEIAEKGEGRWKDIAKSIVDNAEKEGKEEEKEDGDEG